MEVTSELSALQKAAYALKEMRAKLDALTEAQNKLDEPIAIIGMSCRVPGADNLAEFWTLLHNKINAVSEVPPERWSLETYFDPNPNAPGKINVRQGGFIKDVDKFDAKFFSIAPQEATKLDPQHRILLEMTWQALEHAGQAPERLKGSQTGTFIGINQLDYSFWQVSGDPAQFDVYSATSHGFCFAAGRISYTLGLNGPCMPIDTACSSSLVAVHLACQSLHTRECDMALAGGIQLNLSPEFHLLMTKTQSLSPSGACKTFDATADGYILGEGCGMVVLKRLSDAIANRDNVLAILRASGVKHSGASSGITVPNELIEEELVRFVLERGKVHPNEVDFIETHGTGTILGDPIEVGALGEVFRGRDKPLILGAVKTNIGHLDAAAGVAGLIKTVLALQQEEIPPNVHFTTPSPQIDWDKCPMQVPMQPLAWIRREKPRLAGVSSFAITGTMAHVLVQEAPLPSLQTNQISERPYHILTLSAKTAPALRDLVKAYCSVLAEISADMLGNFCFTANTGRSHFNHRLAVVGESPNDLHTQLTAYFNEQNTTQLVTGVSGQLRQKSLKFALLFSDKLDLTQSQILFDTQAVFKQAIQQCQQLKEVVLIDQERLVFTNISKSEAQFIVNYALARVWQSWGIKPAAVFGEGIGEYVAGWFAGLYDLEVALKLVQNPKTSFSWNTPKLPIHAPQLPVKDFGLQQADFGLIFTITTEWQTLLNNLAQLYVQGVAIDWEAFDHDYTRRRMSLPTYPFQRESYWLGPEQTRKPVLADKTVAENLSKETIPMHSTSTEKISEVTVGNQGSLTRIMTQQLNMASQAVSQVIAQQLSFLEQRGLMQPTSHVTAQQNEILPVPDAIVQPNVTPQPTSLTTDWRLLMIAADDAQGLETATQQLVTQLKTTPSDFATLSTLNNGGYRRMTVVKTVEEALQNLDPINPKKVFSNQGQTYVNRSIIFMLPGVGDQYVNMTKGLYQNERVFREHFDQCAELLNTWLPTDLRQVVYPISQIEEKTPKKPAFDFKQMLNRGATDPDTQKLNQTLFSQPAMFCLEYALAKMWIARGLAPTAMIGYSIGEYVAACLAGVMSLADSLHLVVKRAELIETLPKGAMVAVPKSEAELLSLLGEELSISIISTPTQCVVGGTEAAVNQLIEKLKAQEVVCRPLQTTHAFHSKLLLPIKAELADLVSHFKLAVPNIPFISNVTGTWITAQQAIDPNYWARHTCETVRFAEGIATLLQQSTQLFLEVGVGQSLGSFVFQHPNYQKQQQHIILPSLRTRYDQQPDESFLLNTLGRLWLNGVIFQN